MHKKHRKAKRCQGLNQVKESCCFAAAATDVAGAAGTGADAVDDDESCLALRPLPFFMVVRSTLESNNKSKPKREKMTLGKESERRKKLFKCVVAALPPRAGGDSLAEVSRPILKLATS